MPNDKQWQFNLDPTTLNLKDSLKEFEKKPIVTPFFRTLNLTILHTNHTSANIGKEPFKLAIKFPAELAESLNFKYILKASSTNNSVNFRLLFSFYV